jgi:hypothetical protein
MERVYQTRERVRQAFVILAENRYVKRNPSRTTILTGLINATKALLNQTLNVS